MEQERPIDSEGGTEFHEITVPYQSNSRTQGAVPAMAENAPAKPGVAEISGVPLYNEQNEKLVETREVLARLQARRGSSEPSSKVPCRYYLLSYEGRPGVIGLRRACA
jgi:hypothetical protein